MLFERMKNTVEVFWKWWICFVIVCGYIFMYGEIDV